MGAWTDGAWANATFFIGKDSIQYVDDLAFYPYELKEDSLIIDYGEKSIAYAVYLTGDTLIQFNPEFDSGKFIRFID